MAKREMPSLWEQMRTNEVAKQMGIIGPDAAEARTPGRALVEQMASKGRGISPSGDFKTRPGAPLSSLDSIGARTAEIGRGGLTAPSTWNTVFKPSPNIPSLAPTVPTDAAAMAKTWSGLPARPQASDYLREAVGTAGRYSEGILGNGIQAGLSFTGGKYQTPGTEGRVDSGRSLDASRGFMDKLKRTNTSFYARY